MEATAMFPTLHGATRYKVVIDGPQGVGKSALLRRIARGDFAEEGDSGVEAVPHVIEHSLYIAGPTLVHLEVWERLHCIDSELVRDPLSHEARAFQIYGNADAVIVVYDVASRESYNKARARIAKLRARLRSRPVAYGIVGNKSDLVEQRSVAMDEALDYAHSSKLDICLETSAKTAINVTGLFTVVARKLVKASMPVESKSKETPPPSPPLPPSKASPSPSKPCPGRTRKRTLSNAWRTVTKSLFCCSG